jgi:hypothetical protein
MIFDNVAKQMNELLERALQSTTLGMRQTLDGPPSSVEGLSRTELSEYALTMITTLAESVVLLAAEIDALTTKVRELDNQAG